jgi:hypothetical protein
MLYELDLKTLSSLSAGSAKLEAYVKHLASVTIQRHFRGFHDRRESKVLYMLKKRLTRILGPLVKRKLEARHYKAAVRI